MNLIGFLIFEILGDFYFFVQNYERCHYLFIKKNSVGLGILKSGEEFGATIQEILKDHVTRVSNVNEDNPIVHLFYLYELDGEVYVNIEKFLDIYHPNFEKYNKYGGDFNPAYYNVTRIDGKPYIHLPHGKKFLEGK